VVSLETTSLSTKKRMMKNIVFYFFLSLYLITLTGCNSITNTKEAPDSSEVLDQDEDQINNFIGTLKILSLNTWQQGTSVEGGYEALVRIIVASEADVIMLSEIRNYNNTIFTDQIVQSLKDRGIKFYSFNSEKSPVILSKFPINSTPSINSNALAKCIIQLNPNIKVALYAAHLDYTHYACYLPRGYDGITWKKLESPVLEVDKILDQNKASQRDEAIEVFIKDALIEKAQENLVFLAGDFNEPSHLDWGEASKNKFDHNGTVVPWNNSITLEENGFVDSYREKYPDPVTYPGITWPANNMNVDLSKLVWTPEADERDRIDFIYYHENARIELKDIFIVGPVGCIVNGHREDSSPGEDKFIVPEGIWPSDHKGVLATFIIK
jgi:hypothetical protein